MATQKDPERKLRQTGSATPESTGKDTNTGTADKGPDTYDPMGMAGEKAGSVLKVEEQVRQEAAATDTHSADTYNPVGMAGQKAGNMLKAEEQGRQEAGPTDTASASIYNPVGMAGQKAGSVVKAEEQLSQDEATGSQDDPGAVGAGKDKA